MSCRLGINNIKMALAKRIQPARVVVENFAFRSIANVSILDDRLSSARESAVEMAVVRGENDPIVADRLDDVSKLGLVGLTRKK